MGSLKTLHIARHGKSTWDYAETTDIDRPLKERGIQNAITMAERFQKKFPELIKEKH